MDLFYLSSSPLSVSFYFDYVSVSFITIILLIRTVIIIYSFNYMYPYSKRSYFL
ncbi:MAG: hypothetical protein IM483_16635 [Microcystis sp. M122S2]|nr:hypothetical protein [Microcystis sp. M122S2]